MKSPIPILRIFDEAKAKEHYVEFLGFTIDWEHRFGANFPIYMQVSRDECIIHLSEHAGDASPSSTLRIETPQLDEFYSEVSGRSSKDSKPEDPKDQPWGTKDFSITDPFGNRLIFYSAKNIAER